MAKLDGDERAAMIRRRLEADGRVRIAALAQEFAVSEMTVRRDLQELEAEGVARRVRGGAVAVGPVPFAARHQRQARAKQRIAQKLHPLVPSSGAIGIDASSTLLRLASSIQGARDLTVITNGPETFAALQERRGVTALLTGGQLDPRTGSLVGPLAARTAGDLLLSRLFVSAAGVHPDLGPSESCLEEADVKRALGEVAAEIILAADAAKLGQRAVAQSFGWDRIALLVTDLEPTDPRLDPYRRSVEIL